MICMIEVIRGIAIYAQYSAMRMGPYLLVGIVLAAALQSAIPAARLRKLFATSGAWPIVIATAAAVSTPLCSCGTVSIMIPLLAAGVPWGPVFAWLIASPIMGPTDFLLIGGTLGWDMAVTKLLVGLVLGVGLLVDHLQAVGLLAGQSRVPLTIDVGGYMSEFPGTPDCWLPPSTTREKPTFADDASCCAAADLSTAACCEADPGSQDAQGFVPVSVAAAYLFGLLF